MMTAAINTHQVYDDRRRKYPVTALSVMEQITIEGVTLDVYGDLDKPWSGNGVDDPGYAACFSAYHVFLEGDSRDILDLIDCKSVETKIEQAYNEGERV